ncbi:MAG: hypothetical protein ACOCQG_01630 [Candidatus Nanoarchaeia archaeon]
MVYNVLRRERPEPEGRASHRSVTDGGRGLLTGLAGLKDEILTMLAYGSGQFSRTFENRSFQTQSSLIDSL